MKKTITKLKLSRESIRVLSGHDLAPVIGGSQLTGRNMCRPPLPVSGTCGCPPPPSEVPQACTIICNGLTNLCVPD